MVRVYSTFQALMSGNGPSLSPNEHVETFYSNLIKGLDNLERLLTTDFITSEWLLQALEFLKATHSGLIPLVEKLQIPVSLQGDGWFAEYMDETVKLLDVCNALKASVSGLERYQMLVDGVVRALNGPDVFFRAQLFRGLHALDTCKDEAERLETDNKNLMESKIEADGKLYFNLTDKHVESKFLKWNGFWGIMFAVKNISSFLSWLLLWGLVDAGNSFSMKIDTITFRSPWSASFVRLQHRVNVAINQARESNKASKTFFHEFESLQAILADIRGQLRPTNRGVSQKSEESVRQDIQRLRHLSLTLKEGLETVEWRVNDLFDEIVEGRNKLLEIFSRSSS